MRLSLTTLLLLLATSILAQDTADVAGENDVMGGTDPTPTDGGEGDAAPTPAADSGDATDTGEGGGGGTGSTGADDNSLENTKDLTQPWNITYFTYPTRNNYWVNDNENKATWAPVNVATNLMLSHSNTSMLPQRIMLQQNIPGGVGTFATKITGYTPGNNYLLVLSIAGNPDQKLAQSQGFYIKANGTAAPQQVTAQGNQATASAVSNGGSTQPGSGDPAKMQQENAAPSDGGTGNGASASPNANAPAGHSAAERVGVWTGVGVAMGAMAAAVVAPLILLA
ncbi:hypothetical protein A1Q1_05727 [Trichosporon asahii var. asahii CBS 2479]|uniref:Uncharacterized protein n=1 Tax=Trichosporon asahii var. asahii (strain ATCC 90039 / CBS 2479 / JCM 2466 / KCTC 7840 / NBRC 103889/ NCYC 2677 / UAMH 7654) TaxID=1186058 RepID=J6EN87_TRIAS|nr:hypothetical protein A1Q1_05727 [Trichosporon asahii var. asahii CBS 2479]EJT45814.1 hypothetical protein A1Q1_05727 [Trichosporon asahii var. asahii CBS 2479]